MGTRAEATRASHPPTPCIRAHWLACRQVTREQELSIFSSDGSDRAPARTTDLGTSAAAPAAQTTSSTSYAPPAQSPQPPPSDRHCSRSEADGTLAALAAAPPSELSIFSSDGNDRAPGQTTDLGITRSTVEDEPISVATLWLVGKPFPLSSLVMINNLYVSVRKRSRPRFGYESGQLSLSA